MSVPTPALLTARAKAILARERFMATLGEAQDRLAPSTIARNAWDGVLDKSEEAAVQTVEFARDKPAVMGAVAGVLAAAVARRPIAWGIRKLFRRRPKPVVGMPPFIPEPARSGDRV